MIRPEKVHAYLPEGVDIQLAAGGRIRVERTRHEGLFGEFSSPGSAGSRIASAIADNPLLTKFMFLKSEMSVSPGDGRTSLSFPLFLDPECGYVEKAGRSDYGDQGSKLDERIRRLEGEILSSYAALMREWAEAAPDDLGLVGSILRTRDARKMQEEFARAVAGKLGRGKFPADSLRCAIRSSREMNSWVRLKDAARKIGHAQKNARSLGADLRRRDGPRQICTALSKISGMADVSTESVCLDCWFERDQMPFMLEAINTRHVSLPAACMNCGGTGVLHTVSIAFPEPVGTLAAAGSSWLYEAVVGHMASKIDRIERIFVHKKIQSYDGGSARKGVEVDVTAITDRGELYLVEVTKQDDSNHVLENASRKLAHFEGAGIPFSGVIYVTASGHDRYYAVGGARIMQLKHVPDLPRLIEEFMDDRTRGPARA